MERKPAASKVLYQFTGSVSSLRLAFCPAYKVISSGFP
jgi:hypothetical protein